MCVLSFLMRVLKRGHRLESNVICDGFRTVSDRFRETSSLYLEPVGFWMPFSLHFFPEDKGFHPGTGSIQFTPPLRKPLAQAPEVEV